MKNVWSDPNAQDAGSGMLEARTTFVQAQRTDSPSFHGRMVFVNDGRSFAFGRSTAPNGRR